ncbi:MAG TPA: SDR family oxidoreductase [Planosporangium sp.]|jgi:NAD(P)-dependent dehydrogenase (short-subunit alcohol dehydrogenase family)|nr:SDR family oxidoreductase [Planosporangium sp.]
MMFSLAGKRALVTGGARGIGQAVARGLARQGASVAILDHDEAGAVATAEEIAAETGVTTAGVPCDVTRSASVDQAVAVCVEALGGLDIAVNNAGIGVFCPAEDLDDDSWDSVMDVNLRGVFICARAEARVMLAQGTGGSIINTASMSAQIAVPQPQVSYNTSKGGVVMLTRSLAAEWAPRGVRVNCVSPGFTLTPLVRQEPIASQHELWRSLTPMGRLAEPEDLVGAYVYLASDSASFTTGADLVVDGGYTVR